MRIDAQVVAARFAFACSLMVARGLITSNTSYKSSLHLAPEVAYRRFVNVRSTTMSSSWNEPGNVDFLFKRLWRSLTVVEEALSIASANSFSSSTMKYGESPFIAAAALCVSSSPPEGFILNHLIHCWE
jgi:hypothetical protein